MHAYALLLYIFVIMIAVFYCAIESVTFQCHASLEPVERRRIRHPRFQPKSRPPRHQLLCTWPWRVPMFQPGPGTCTGDQFTIYFSMAIDRQVFFSARHLATNYKNFLIWRSIATASDFSIDRHLAIDS